MESFCPALYSKVDVGPTTHQAVVLWNQLWLARNEKPMRSFCMKSIFDRPPSKLIVTELSKNFCKKLRKRRERSIFCNSTQFVAFTIILQVSCYIEPLYIRLRNYDFELLIAGLFVSKLPP